MATRLSKSRFECFTCFTEESSFDFHMKKWEKQNKREREGESIEEDAEQNMPMDAGENEEEVIWKQRKTKRRERPKI